MRVDVAGFAVNSESDAHRHDGGIHLLTASIQLFLVQGIEIVE